MSDKTLFITSQNFSLECIMYLINSSQLWVFHRVTRSIEFLVLRLPPVLLDLRLPSILLDPRPFSILLDLQLAPFFYFANCIKLSLFFVLYAWYCWPLAFSLLAWASSSSTLTRPFGFPPRLLELQRPLCMLDHLHSLDSSASRSMASSVYLGLPILTRHVNLEERSNYNGKCCILKLY